MHRAPLKERGGVNQQSETWYCKFADAPKKGETEVGKRF